MPVESSPLAQDPSDDASTQARWEGRRGRGSMLGLGADLAVIAAGMILVAVAVVIPLPRRSANSGRVGALPSTSSQTPDVRTYVPRRAVPGRIEWAFATNDDLRRWEGDPNLRELLIDDSNIDDAGLTHLKGCTSLEHLRIRNAPITDRGIEVLTGLPALRIVNLPQARFTDAGLARLAALPNLELLRFGSPRVTDAGVQSLKRAARLRFLHLIDVPITEKGLEEIVAIPGLESLYLDGVRLSDDAMVRLFERRPDLHVHLDQRHHDRDPRATDHNHGSGTSRAASDGADAAPQEISPGE